MRTMFVLFLAALVLGVGVAGASNAANQTQAAGSEPLVGLEASPIDQPLVGEKPQPIHEGTAVVDPICAFDGSGCQGAQQAQPQEARPAETAAGQAVQPAHASSPNQAEPPQSTPQGK